MTAPRDPLRESQRRLRAAISNEIAAIEYQGLEDTRWRIALERCRDSVDRWLVPEEVTPEQAPGRLYVLPGGKGRRRGRRP